MKKALLFAAISISLPSLLLACASGNNDNTGGSGGSSSSTTKAATNAASTSAQTSGAQTSTSTGGACGACNIDSDCANTCPAVPANQSNCCDTMTNTCFINMNSATCPNAGTTSAVSSGSGQMY